ncbi:YifB family Mg chelatase-like AAA ATPase [Pendulispora albinea]|uniref:YifB family Mg chelatase-like AAA ATPase n=1 Tax=Pendulispora albinea TaxID=2741071 RepID=A0ABZ2M5G6_9BACT
MLATTLSATLIGLQAQLVRVEVEVTRGVPSFELVGLAEATVRESRVRVKSALAHLGVDLSEYRIVMNLAPADLPKTGSAFDLAIAVATLGALGVVDEESFADTLLLGELSLAGTVQSIRGALALLIGVRSCGVTKVIVPACNEGEAGLVPGIEVRAARTLQHVVAGLCGDEILPLARPAWDETQPQAPDDLSDVRGQLHARRALEIAAAGGHNLLMVGSPGAGKTMLARRLPSVLPALSVDEALEVTAIHSVARAMGDFGLLGQARGPLSSMRPFRAPHHTVSEVGMVGGGGEVRPGEVSLAHHGVLFLDELPEFRRAALEALRQPLEDGVVSITRAHATATYPARPLVVAAMNACPCGYYGDGTSRCSCTLERIRTYRGRVSGPLLDRMDVQVALPPVHVPSLTSAKPGESSTVVAARVRAARAVQSERMLRGETSMPTNATLHASELARVAGTSAESISLLTKAATKYGLSARAYGKILRVARTVADLAGATAVSREHILEAIQLRLLDRFHVANHVDTSAA